MPGEASATRHVRRRGPCHEQEIRDLSAGFGERVLLHIEGLHLPASGITGLIGPSGGGKSTLLKLLAGTAPGGADFWVRTDATDSSDPDQRGPGSKEGGAFLLEQRARLPGGPVVPSLQRACGASDARAVRKGVEEMIEEFSLGHDMASLLSGDAENLSYGQQKLLLIAAYCHRRPARLFLDEPTRSMSTTEERELLRVLDRLRNTCAVWTISHDKEFIRMSCDRIVLLAGGMVAEQAPCVDFFEEPSTPTGRAFLRAGSAWPLIDAGDRNTRAGEGSGETPAPRPSQEEQPTASGPPVTWILDRLLGGCPMPGLLGEPRKDLAGLRGQGTDVLVTLTEDPPAGDLVARYQMHSLHFPIVDMQIPSDLDALSDLIGQIESCIGNGVAVVFHCKAGLGRTGLMLACTLVKLGFTPEAAVERVRSREQRMIQTERQEAFIADYAAYLEACAPHPAPA